MLLYTIDMVPMESQRNDISFSQYNCEKTGPRDFPDIELLFKSESESEI